MTVLPVQQDRSRLVVLHADDRPAGLEDGVGPATEIIWADAAGLPAALAGADALLVWDFASDAVRDSWAAADALRWVHTASAGVDRLLFDGLLRSEVVITNSRGVFDVPMAEYVLGLVLAYAKDLPGTLWAQERREWRHRETTTAAGTRAVVVGGGPIGVATAALLRAVGLRVDLVGRRARDGVHAIGELPGLLGDCDWLILAAPLTERTRGLVDADLLARLPPTARLINVGRGALVREDDLVAALRAGELAGAALDVFCVEPLPSGHPLWSLAGVIVSPHMSGDAAGWRDTLVDLFVDNLTRYRTGQPLRNVVDKEHGYVRSSS